MLQSLGLFSEIIRLVGCKKKKNFKLSSSYLETGLLAKTNFVSVIISIFKINKPGNLYKYFLIPNSTPVENITTFEYYYYLLEFDLTNTIIIIMTFKMIKYAQIVFYHVLRKIHLHGQSIVLLYCFL